MAGVVENENGVAVAAAGGPVAACTNTTVPMRTAPAIATRDQRITTPPLVPRRPPSTLPRWDEATP